MHPFRVWKIWIMGVMTGMGAQFLAYEYGSRASMSFMVIGAIASLFLYYLVNKEADND